MSRWLRAALFAAGFAGAFCLGQLLTRPATTTPPNVTLVAAAPVPERSIQTPMMEPPAVMPPIGPPTSPDELEVNKNDIAFKVIEKGLGIETTVVDRSEPPPAVLVQAGKEDVPPVPEPGIKIPEKGGGADLPAPLPADPRLPEPRIADLDVPGSPVAQPPKVVEESGPKLLNTRSVSFDFQVTRVGLSQVKAVELWATRDKGTTWEKFDRMNGARSPFHTRLSGPDGVYGFKLVFESESGMRTPEPRPGQAPDRFLELDTTPPNVAIFPVRPIANQPGTVLITWNAEDRNIDHATVRVEYSLDARQWHLITTGKNLTVRGRFAWKVPNELPPKLFLRVSVSDTAGNTAVAQTSEQTSIDLVAPEGKITGIRPDATDDRGPMPREVGEVPARAGGMIPIEELLKALIPAVLNSPVPAKDLIEEWLRAANERPDPNQAREMDVREWLDQLTRYDVVLESPRFEYSRRDPFAIPALGPELTPNPNHWEPMWNSSCGVAAMIVALDRFDYSRPLIWTRQFESSLRRRLAQESATYAGSRSLMKVTSDPDWKPSTAAPETIESWDLERFRRPFNGAYDGPFWGSFPGPGIVLDF
jgi:hypothetical protein